MRIFDLYKRLAAELLGVVIAIVVGGVSAYAQLDHGEMMDEYIRQTELLPPISVIVDFKSLTDEKELRIRFERSMLQRSNKVSTLTTEQLEQIREELKLPDGENVVEEFFEAQDDASFSLIQDWNQASGIFEFFGGNIREIRRLSTDRSVLRTLQYGLAQPKLRSSRQDIWVIKEFSEQFGRTLVRSESKVELEGMLPVGAFRGSFHRTIAEKFPSGFDLFWERSPEIKPWGKAADGDLYIKAHPSDPKNWLIACFENPESSIVPLWIAGVHAPERSELDANCRESIVKTVARLPSNESTSVPKAIYIPFVSLFEQRVDIEQFKGYPKTIRRLVPIESDSPDDGFIIGPLMELKMQVTGLTVRPADRVAFEIEDDSDYHDFDRKIGWTIGVNDPPIARNRLPLRIVLWLAAALLVAVGIYQRLKRR